jgi:hypothetical protein
MAIRFSDVFIDASMHQDPAGVAFAVQCESGGTLDEIRAIADLIYLATQNPDSAPNDETIAYAAMLIKRLVDQKQIFDQLEYSAREAARSKAGGLKAVGG